MAIPECAICLENIGLGDARATLRGCYHQFCTQCIVDAVVFYNKTKCPQCKKEIGTVHWGGNSLEVLPSVPEPAPAAAAMPADPGPDLYYTSQDQVVHVQRIATDMTLDAVATHFGIPTAQVINMNTTRPAGDHPWRGDVHGSSVLRAGTDVWLWYTVV